MLLNSFRYVLVVSLLLLTQQASGHEVRPSLLKLTEIDATSWQGSFKQPQVQGRFLNLSVNSNCEITTTDQMVTGRAVTESFDLHCQHPLNLIEIDGLQRTMVDTMVIITSASGYIENYLITARQPYLELTKNNAAVPAYLAYGVEHLLLGFDHIFFVLVLLYIIKGWMNLIKVITSFTLAHSISLGLSAYDIISLPQAPIEALIALSIVLLAVECVQTDKSAISQQPWLVAFAFGLLHGLGFAGALADIGLPEASAFWALLLFNIGIEIGQLLVVAAAFISMYLLQGRVSQVIAPLNFAPVYIMGCLACFWFIQRSWQIFI